MMHEALQMIHNNQMNQKMVQKKQMAVRSRKTSQNELNYKSIQNITRSAPQLKTAMFTSSITVHKLRESKWFKNNEMKILLSVVESGFVLEKRLSGNENEEFNFWGIALWEPGQEKSKDKKYIKIYTLTGEKDKLKVTVLTLEEFWGSDIELRINNQHDKEKTTNSEDDIRKQIDYALKNKTHKWHNSEHFVYFCRYEKPMHGRIQQISERVRWNSLGVSLGMLMRGRNRRPTASK